jgi:hypothetical protein
MMVPVSVLSLFKVTILFRRFGEIWCVCFQGNLIVSNRTISSSSDTSERTMLPSAVLEKVNHMFGHSYTGRGRSRFDVAFLSLNFEWYINFTVTLSGICPSPGIRSLFSTRYRMQQKLMDTCVVHKKLPSYQNFFQVALQKFKHKK